MLFTLGRNIPVEKSSSTTPLILTWNTCATHERWGDCWMLTWERLAGNEKKV